MKNLTNALINKTTVTIDNDERYLLMTFDDGRHYLPGIDLKIINKHVTNSELIQMLLAEYSCSMTEGAFRKHTEAGLIVGETLPIVFCQQNHVNDIVKRFWTIDVKHIILIVKHIKYDKETNELTVNVNLIDKDIASHIVSCKEGYALYPRIIGAVGHPETYVFIALDLGRVEPPCGYYDYTKYPVDINTVKLDTLGSIDTSATTKV